MNEVLAGYDLGHHPGRFAANALVLDGEVEMCLGTQVCLIPEFGDDHGVTAQQTKTSENGVVEPFE